MSETEVHIKEAKEEMREQYKEETGEELPEHVVENFELISVGPTFEDMEQSLERGKELAEKEHTTRDVWAYVTIASVIVGVVSYGAGITLAGSFGLAIVALVSSAFGFTVGSMIVSA